MRLFPSRLLAGFLAAMLILSGCSDTNTLPPQIGQDGRLVVYTSFYPLFDFTQKIGGDRVWVINLLPAGGEPHDWEPTPKDILGLEKADLLVTGGLGLERWVGRVLNSLQNSGLMLVETATAVEQIRFNENVERLGSPERLSADTHIWLSPKNAAAQSRAILNALIELDPEGQDYYTTRYNAFAAELDKLDLEFRRTLEALPNKTIAVSHLAFGYLCGEYGLTQLSARGISPDEEPGLAAMARLADLVRENDIQVIFFEEAASAAFADAIVRETGASTDVLSPLESLTPEQEAQGMDYLAVMRQNLDALRRALE